ncbi:MAG: hypothetical protein WB803_24835 [Pseudolabrys sp.]
MRSVSVDCIVIFTGDRYWISFDFEFAIRHVADDEALLLVLAKSSVILNVIATKPATRTRFFHSTNVVCYVISDRHFAALAKETPAAAIKLLSGLGRELSRRLRRANLTIHQLEA